MVQAKVFALGGPQCSEVERSEAERNGGPPKVAAAVSLGVLKE